MRRITKPLALLLALVMVIGLLPMTALAAVDGGSSSATISTTEDWGNYTGSAQMSLTFGKKGNKIKVWVNEGNSSDGVNISAIQIGGVTKQLSEGTVETYEATFNNGVIENLSRGGAYAVINVDSFNFGDINGTQTVTFTYATENDGFELHANSSYDDEETEETSEPTSEPTTDPSDPSTPSEPDPEPTTGYKTVTVTGIEKTDGWDSTNKSNQNWFTVPNVQLDPDGTITVRQGESGKGINISAIKIGNREISITDLKASGSVTVDGTDDAGNKVNLENPNNGDKWQIAHLEISGVSATIKLSDFGITAGVYDITFTYAIASTSVEADLVVESSAGEGSKTFTYDKVEHGNPNGTYAPPSGTASTTTERQKVSTNDSSNPKKAIWFFDSHKEVKSFNTKNDTYEDELKHKGGEQPADHKNNLTLYSSTDGSIRAGKGGELWINWESMNRESPANVGTKDLMGTGYTDGSYTVVGWGGDFQANKKKNTIRFVVKDGGDNTLVDALSHLTIYLVDKEGKIEDKVWVQSNNPNGENGSTEVDSLRYVKTLDGGYHVYEAKLNGKTAIQGIKLAFDRCTQTDSYREDGNTHHSGTLIISDVRIDVEGAGWVDFSPFNYSEDDSQYENPYKSPVNSGSRPFLRSNHFQSTLKEGAHEGYNLAYKQGGPYEWHIWTMSTSDANIVNNDYSSADALQIKYSNTYSHRTYTRLVGETELNGEWLVMTLGGEVDAGTKFQLVNSEEPNSGSVVKTLELKDFTTTKDGDQVVTAEMLSDGTYHTIYYHMQGETFKSVYVDFSNVSPSEGHASRYMYITEIYLLEPAAKIEKAVDKKEAASGEELVYTLTVTNNDAETISQFTVTDTLPEGVSYVSSNPANGVTVNGQTIIWTYSDNLKFNESVKLEITVKINTDFQGTLVNSATITYLEGKDKSIGSNEVTTVVTLKTPDNFVFYAEVGQKTTLPFKLGNTASTDGEKKQDIVASVPTSSANNAAIEANGIVGQDSGSLLYTGKSAGKDTFTLTYNPGGDTTQTQTAKVTVYNYKVDNQIYVLDYGLSVNLTSGKGSFLNNDKVKLSIDGDDAGYAFAGLSNEKRNKNKVADVPTDYATSYGSTEVTGQNGIAKWNGLPNTEKLSVTFTPTTFMSSVDTFYYGVQVSKNNTYPSDATNATPVMEGQIKVMPANVVYYEDNFSQSGSTEDGANGVNGIIYTGATTVSSNAKTFEWQTNDQDSLYGYDKDAYTGEVGDYSNGSAHQLEITGRASFTFTGTGFDIIGRTTDSTGILRAMIYAVDDEGKETFKKFVIVDTYYENGDLYQIPVVSVLNLEYGKYKVVLVAARGYADEYAGKTSTVYIDGVRIYNPLGEKGNEDYKEEEQGAKFMEVKGMIFGENFKYDRNNPENSYWDDSDEDAVGSTATLIKFVKYNGEEYRLNGATLVEILKNRNDTSETLATEPGRTFDLLTYAFSGPNKELYLEDGYGFGFAPDLEQPDEPATLQIGVKLISKTVGSSDFPTIEYLDENGEWKKLCTVTSSTEKYYSLDKIMKDLYYEQVILRISDNHSGAVVSVTNVKYKNYKFESITTTNERKETSRLLADAITVLSGYDNTTGKFKKGSITMTVKTKQDIQKVCVYSDANGNEPMTLLKMTYKDSSQDGEDVRIWTIKFKGTEKRDNYWLKVVNQYGNFSNLVMK